MTRDHALALRRAAEEVGAQFSRTDRAKNYAAETYAIDRIIPLSDAVAAVIYSKSPTGKLAAAAFYYVNGGQSASWRYFFLTYQHTVGLEKLRGVLDAVERHNFPLNFSSSGPE